MSDTEDNPSKIRKIIPTDCKPVPEKEVDKDVGVANAPEDEEELFSFFEKTDDDDEQNETHNEAPIASSTFIEDVPDEDGGTEDESKTLINSLDSFLVEAKEAEESKAKTSASEQKDETVEAKEDEGKVEEAEQGKEEETEQVKEASELKNTIIIVDGIEIDVEEVLRKDPDEDKYYDQLDDLDFDLDFEEILEGTQMYTYVDDEDDGLVDIADITLPDLPLPVPARMVTDQEAETTMVKADNKDADQPALAQVTSTPLRSAPAPVEREVKVVKKINPYNMRQQYYHKAKVMWQKDLNDLPEHRRPHFEMPNVSQLPLPRGWKHPTIPNQYYGFEDIQEWSDRCHPLWQEYRKLDLEKHTYAQFVHHKWDYKRGIDITRNLTRFSQITQPGESQPQEQLQTGQHLLPCQYCEKVCFCSAGRKLKKPYKIPLNVLGQDLVDSTVPDDRKERDLITKDEFQSRIVFLMEKQMNENRPRRDAPPTEKNVQEVSKKAINAIASSEEAFELAAHYRSGVHDIMTFSDDQVKELLSLEETLEAFKFHYKSPYDEGDSDDDTGYQEGDRTISGVTNSNNSSQNTRVTNANNSYQSTRVTNVNNSRQNTRGAGWDSQILQDY